MARLVLLDGRETVYQWDTNIQVELQDGIGDELHFAVRGSNVAVVRELDENNRCIIPDVCLQTSGTLRIYSFYNGDENYTCNAFVINVVARAKPIDYIEPEAEETLVDLIALRLKSDPEFIEATKGEEGDPGEDGNDGVSPTVTVTDITGGHRITITDATGDHVFDVMDGQGGGGSSDHRLLTNRNAEDQHNISAITGLQTALDNKLDSDDLDDAIDEALATAKASGEFDGEKGDKGDPGDDGYTPVKGVDYFDGAKGDKGDKGDTGAAGTSAGFGTPTASVDTGTGTPSVNVTASGSDTAKVFNFAFHNLKGATGAKGDKGDTGDKGDKGDTGDPGTTSWNGITDKPSTFPPSTHNHTTSQITDIGNLAPSKVTIGNTEYTLRIGTTGAAGYITFVLE